MKQSKQITLLIFTATWLILSGCNQEKTYSKDQGAVAPDNITRISFHPANLSHCQSEFQEFEIWDQQLINDFTLALNNSKLDGPWKGACFNQITIHTLDSNITLSTNGDVFGYGSSGIFYRFPETGFIEKLVVAAKNIEPLIKDFIPITNFNHGQSYEKLTAETLDSIPDYHLVEIVSDNIDLQFTQGEPYGISEFESLSPGQQAIFATYWLHAEVMNGGLIQYYINPSGKFSKYTEEAFKLMDAQDYLVLMTHANHIQSIPATSESIDSIFDEQLSQLNSQFYELDEKSPLEDIQVQYIRNNIDQFVVSTPH